VLAGDDGEPIGLFALPLPPVIVAVTTTSGSATSGDAVGLVWAVAIPAAFAPSLRRPTPIF